MITKDAIDAWFTYHKPTEDQQPKFVALREKAREFAHLIVELTPPGPDQSTAIRQLRECVMTANAAIVLDGKIPATITYVPAATPSTQPKELTEEARKKIAGELFP